MFKTLQVKFANSVRIVVMALSALALTACASSGVPASRAAKSAAPAAVASQQLLDMIPAKHPQRMELRRVAMQPPPDGFSAEEWLRLSMKIDIRSAGNQMGKFARN